VDPKTFGMNIWLLIGAAIWLGLAFLLVIGMITAVRILWWLRRRRAAERAAKRARRAPDGTLCVYVGPGLCDRCGLERHRVYVAGPGDSCCARCFADDAATDELPSPPTGTDAGSVTPYSSSSCFLTAHQRAADVG
jgi:hypothetical protein